MQSQESFPDGIMDQQKEHVRHQKQLLQQQQPMNGSLDGNSGQNPHLGENVHQQKMRPRPQQYSQTQSEYKKDHGDFAGLGGDKDEKQAREKRSKRSAPIAINRPPSTPDSPNQPESDEDDDLYIDVETDAEKLRSTNDKIGTDNALNGDMTKDAARELLKAPYLGSMSRSESYLTRKEDLLYLPPMSLSDFQGVPNDTISYGSLRESHEVGRFQDGPASYRDRRSGQIRLIERGSRSSSSMMPQISIGERIQQFRKIREIQKKKESNSSKQQPTSTLSALMDNVPPDSKVEDLAPLPPTYPERTIAMNDAENMTDSSFDNFSNIASTSLTGFEVLKASSKYGIHGRAQSAGRVAPVLGPSPQTPSPQSLLLRPPAQQTFQPLSRSMSDPTPRFHNPRRTQTSQTMPTISQPPSSASLANDSIPDISRELLPSLPPPFVEPDSVGTPHSHLGSRAAAMAVINDLCSFTLPSSSGYSHDLDGAFDMDMDTVTDMDLDLDME